jgi:hypothetical protein
MSNIFKIYINNNNNLTDLYIFIKNKYLSNNLLYSVEELQSKYQNAKDFIRSDLFNDVFKYDFSNLDIKYILDFDISIYFIDENIYYDDTLEIIKFKFLKYYNQSISLPLQVSYEEIYMYGLINKKYNPSELYNILSDNNNTKITNENLKQYLLNVNEQIEIYENILKFNKNIEPDYFDFDSINSIQLDDINILTPIGQNINNKLPHSYTTNPFQVKKYSNYIKTIINTSLNTNNSNLLFEYNLVNDTLFICLFQDVLNYSKKISLEEDITIKLYFPLISINQLNTLELFNKNKKTFLDKTNKHISLELFKNKNSFIDILHYINFNFQKFPELNYTINGIKNLNFNIHTKINLSLSLESLFKIINSTKIMPFIKYNPGKKHENIYRLFCNKKNKENNKKLPLLSKELIIKFSRITGKNNTISIIIFNDEPIVKNNVKLFIVEIDIYGSINVKIELFNHLNIQQLDSIIELNINPVLTIIKKNINNDTNNISYFTSLIDNNIELINLNYTIKIESKLSIKLLSNIKNCLYFFFNIISDKTKEKIYRYKRVSNYNEMNDKDAFIIELIKQKETPVKIIQQLKENFKIESTEEASKIFETTIQSLNLVQNIFNYRKLKIKNSPGFLFKIDNNINNHINISIENIDNIRYIHFIKLYIDSIFKISFNDTKDIDLSICKSSKIKEEQFTEDIVPDEIAVDLNQKNIGNVLNNPIEIDLDDAIDVASSIDDDEEGNNLLDILLDDDDDDDDDEEEEKEDVSQKDEEELEIEPDNDTIKPQKLKDFTPKDIQINLEEDDEEDLEEELEEEEEEEEEVQEEEELKEKEIKQNEKSIKEKVEEDEEKFKKFKESTRGNPILNRLEKLQPGLFKVKTYKPNLAKEDTNKNYVSYSRLCQSARQPVILNEEEKQKVLIDNPKYTSNDILEYSTNPAEKYYYVCPKFWDLDKNSTLTKEQVESGEYGTIYSKGKGNIYKFESKDREPAFLKDTVADEYGNEFCLPCCFSKLKKPNEDKGNRTCNITTKVVKQGDIKYIIRSDKFPLEQYKVGHLPINVKKFLQFDSDDCINPDNNNLKYKYTCLLRYGVQNDKNNSFLACIADAFSKEILKTNTTISIDEMKNIVIKSLTVDNFITYNNANLVQIFLNKNITEQMLESFDISKFENNSIFYNKLDKSNYNHINLYKRILISFENFKLYLKGNNYLIDYSYLWDIICKPNPLLFPNGINLIILDITSYDLTDNVKVICPKQNYSYEFVDDSRKNLILLMKEQYFEPLYLIRTEVTDIITPLISFTSKSSESRLNEFKKVINFIKEDLNNNCLENESKNMKFEKNISLENIINILNKLGYEINFQVMDYENKVIAVIVSNHIDYEGYRYIPCYPSKIYDYYEIPIKFIDELTEEFFTDYNSSKEFLQHIYDSTNQIIKCKPLYKIIDQDLTIGILTNANQFVMINKPEVYVKDDLPEISDKNYLFTDIIIQNKFNNDEERKQMINNIKLESGFYNSFRNTILKLLSEYRNYKFNIKLKDIIKNNALIYFDKLKLIRDELEILAQDYIMFAEYDQNILDNIKNFSLCINNSSCDTDFCMINTSTNICNLIIPKFNLITNDDNYNIYFTKLSDEFTRYNKTKLLLFNSSNFISFNNIKYNINEDEIILMESVLAQEIKSTGLQFKDPYSNYNTFDTYNIKSSTKINKVDTSKITTEYEDFDLDKIQTDEKIILKLPKEQVEKIKLLEKKYLQEKQMEEDLPELEEDLPELEEDLPPLEEVPPKMQLNMDVNIDQSINEYVKSINCKHKKNAIKELDLNNLFIDRVYEFYFDIDSNKICSFELILFILKHFYSKSTELNLTELDILDLKNLLIEEYFNNEYTEAFILTTLQINKKLVENSSSIGTIIKNKLKTSPFLKTQEFKILLSDLINSPDFFITYMDIYLIAKKFNLPIILICNSVINLSITEKTFIILNKNTQNNNYYFIKVPSTYHRGVKNYKLLYFRNSSTINIRDNLVDTDKIQLKTEILLELENYKDLILNAIINFDSKKVDPKNKKLIKKLKK